MVKRRVSAAICLASVVVIAFFYWCLPFGLVHLFFISPFPFFKHIFSFLIFIVMLTKATQLSITTAEKFIFCGFFDTLAFLRCSVEEVFFLAFYEANERGD